MQSLIQAPVDHVGVDQAPLLAIVAVPDKVHQVWVVQPTHEVDLRLEVVLKGRLRVLVADALVGLSSIQG